MRHLIHILSFLILAAPSFAQDDAMGPLSDYNNADSASSESATSSATAQTATPTVAAAAPAAAPPNASCSGPSCAGGDAASAGTDSDDGVGTKPGKGAVDGSVDSVKADTRAE